MSLEVAIDKQTAAIAENTASLAKLIEITTRLHDLRADAIEKVSAVAATTKAPTKAEKAAAAAEAKVAVEAPAEPMQISTNPEDRQEPAPAPVETAPVAPPALSPISQSIVNYVSATDDAAERDARKAKVAEILTKVGAKTAKEVPADKEQPFINTMVKLLEQGNILKPAQADDGDLLG